MQEAQVDEQIDERVLVGEGDPSRGGLGAGPWRGYDPSKGHLRQPEHAHLSAHQLALLATFVLR